MGWQSSLDGLSEALGSGTGGWGSYNANSLLRAAGTNSTMGGGGFSGMSLGGMTVARTGSLNRDTADSYTPAGFPQRMDVSAPWTRPGKTPVLPDTTGDFLGSVGASWGNAWGEGGYLNIGNVIPWGMERMPVLVSQVAKDLTGDDDNVVSAALDAVAGGLKQYVFDPVAAVIDAPFHAWRDIQLNQRLMVYKALVTGQSIGPLEALVSNMLGGVGLNVMQTTGVGMMAGKLSGADRALAMASIDLPDSAKRAIERDPGGDLMKYLDADPKGRQVSYIHGALSDVTNVGTYLGILALEIMLTSGAAGAFKIAAGGAALGSRIRLSYNALAAGAKYLHLVQKAALATGASYYPLAMTFDAIARTQGDKEAVAWWDKVNRSVLISDSLSVQLVTSLSVSPAPALRLAKRGVVKFVRAAEPVFDKVTAGHLTRLYTHRDATRNILAKAFNLTPDEVESRVIGPTGAYDNWTDATNRVVEWAVDYMGDRIVNIIPRAERVMLLSLRSTPGAVEEWVLRKYGVRIARVMKEEPNMVADRLRRDWLYRDFVGPPNTDVAIMLERDYMATAKIAGVARARGVDVVPGLLDLLNPEAQAKVATEINRLYARGNVTLHDWNMLLKDYSALRGTINDLVPGKAAKELVPREAANTALQRAVDKYDDAARQNPNLVKRGVEPVLRPFSPNATKEWADALGTNEETINALAADAKAWDAATRDLVEAFARDKGFVGDVELTRLSNEALWEKVTAQVEDMTRLWRERGEVVAKVEEEIAALGDEEVRLANEYTATHGALPVRLELDRVRAQRAALENTIADAIEPRLPASQSVKFGRREAFYDKQVAAAARQLDALERLETINAINAEIDAWNTIGGVARTTQRTVRKGTAPEVKPNIAEGASLDQKLAAVQAAKAEKRLLSRMRPAEVRTSTGTIRPIDMIRQRSPGAPWTWAGGHPPMTNSIYQKLMDFQNRTGHAGIAQSMHEMGDADLWALAWKSRDAGGFRNALTPAQRRALDSVMGRGRPGSSLDEYKAAWDRGGSATDEDFLQYLVEKRTARDAALDGTSEFNLHRAADVRMPQWAVDEAIKGSRADLWENPVEELARSTAQSRLAYAIDGGPSGFPLVGEIVKGDPMLASAARTLAEERGLPLDDFLGNSDNAAAIRTLAGEVGEQIVPGVLRALTELDQAIGRLSPYSATELAGMKAAMSQLRGRIAEPLHNVPQEAARQLARTPRPSGVLASEMADAGVDWHAPIDMALWDGKPTGAQVASFVLHLDLTHPPRTANSLLMVLREIENGGARNLGFGVDYLAEAQANIQRILRHVIGDARGAQLELGVLGLGKGVNRYTLTQDEWGVISDLLAKHGEKAGLVVRDDRMGLQYGFKQPPSDALVLDMSTVPGLVEEVLSGNFLPWTERVGIAHVRQLFNIIFAPRANQTVFYEARGRFMEALKKKGVPAELSNDIWTRWKKFSRDPYNTGPLGMPFYATERNIPTAKLKLLADEEVTRFAGEAGDLPFDAAAVDFVTEFRLSTSFVRRNLQNLPLGKVLQATYGAVMHNSFVTTWYYMARFLMDIRYHAMNLGESRLLYTGEYAATQDAGHLIEGGRGMFGMTKESITRRVADDMDPSFSFAHTRDVWISRAVAKKQPAALRGLMENDPELVKAAEDGLRALAEHDPVLRDLIAASGGTTDDWLRLLDKQYDKILNSADPAAAVNSEMLRDLVGNPELAEVYGRIGQVNDDLLASIRATYYGNPARSNIERWANHYLLFWPISYQIKTTKWLLRMMYDRAGGLQTNSFGAYALDQMAQVHERLLIEDPEYAEFMDEHRSCLFLAQQLFPITPYSIGVSLSPLMRDALYGSSKGVLEVGPIYSMVKLAPAVYGELYRDFHEVPGFDLPLRILGKEPPKDLPPWQAPWDTGETTP